MLNFNYINDLEKRCFWEIVNVDNENDFKKLLLQVNSGDNLYRGVSDKSYKLYSSFQRNLIKHNFACVNAKYEGLFDETLLNSEATKINYSNSNQLNIRIKIDLVIRLNSHIQHYYGITPYLDVSDDFNTALFFAFRDVSGSIGIDNYVSVAAIPKLGLSRSEAFIKQIEQSFSSYDDFQADNQSLLNLDATAKTNLVDLNVRMLESIFNATKEEYVWFERNNINGNERIIAQRGSFLFFRPRLEIKDNSSFEELYFNAHGSKLTCYHISTKLKDYVRQYLTDLKIDEYSLKLKN